MVLKIIDNQGGYTLFELLVALVIIVLISTLVVVQIQVKDVDKIRIDTERIASDLRRARNLATSGVVDSTTGVYPLGGYGIYFYGSKQQYSLFADLDGDAVYTDGVDTLIEDVDLSDNILIKEQNSSDEDFTIVFKNEHNIVTDIASSGGNEYPIEIYASSTTKKGVISLFDLAVDGYTWGNISVTYLDN